MSTLIPANSKNAQVALNPFKKVRCSTGTALETAIETKTAIRKGRSSLVSHFSKNGAKTPIHPTADVNTMYLMRAIGRQ